MVPAIEGLIEARTAIVVAPKGVLAIAMAHFAVPCKICLALERM
jgi:hypothetical protein